MLGWQGKLQIQQLSKNTAFIPIQLPKRLVSGVYIFMIIYRRSDGTLIGTETFMSNKKNICNAPMFRINSQTYNIWSQI